jgi:hypothetical protein
MFNFNEVYRKALNDSLPLMSRWSNTKRCVFKHARLIDHSFSGTLARFCNIFDIDIENTNNLFSLQQSWAISSLLSALLAEHTRFSEKYNKYRIQRNIHKKNGKLYSVSKYLRQLHTPDYYDSRCVFLAPWMEKGKFGYIDSKGEFAISPQFDFAEPFAGERAAVKIQGTLCNIDKMGNMVSVSDNRSNLQS